MKDSGTAALIKLLSKLLLKHTHFLEATLMDFKGCKLKCTLVCSMFLPNDLETSNVRLTLNGISAFSNTSQIQSHLNPVVRARFNLFCLNYKILQFTQVLLLKMGTAALLRLKGGKHFK